MPRPTDIDEQLAKWDAEVAAAEASMPADLVIAYANPQVRAKLHEINVAGKWLRAELQKVEVDEEKLNKFCFAFGQRCFMAPDVWDLALKTVELLKKNQATVAANAPPPYITRDYPEEERKALFEKYTRVHSE